MKKYTILFALIVAFQFSIAQTVVVGGRGSFNNSWLLNKQHKDFYKTSFGHSKGIMVGINFMSSSYYSDNYFGINVDLLSTHHKQKYQGVLSSGELYYEFNRQVSLTYIDIPILMRYGHDRGGTYLEIGPQYSILTSATESFTSANPEIASFEETDVKDKYVPAQITAVMAFGVDFYLTNELFLSTGVRMNYGLSNAAAYQFDSATRRASGGFMVALFYKFNHYHSNGKKPSSSKR